MFGTPIVDINDLQEIDKSEEELNNEWKVTTRVLTYKGRIYVPKHDLRRNKVISRFDDTRETSHFGAFKTGELMSRDFHPAARDTTVQKFIAGCIL